MKNEKKDLPGIFRSLGIEIDDSHVEIVGENTFMPVNINAVMCLGQFECDMSATQEVVYCYSKNCQSVFKFNKKTKKWEFYLDPKYLNGNSVSIKDLEDTLDMAKEQEPKLKTNPPELLEYFEIMTLEQIQKIVEDIPVFKEDKEYVGCVN